MDSQNSQARSWRPLRIVLALTLIFITLQGITGGVIAGSGNFPVGVHGPLSAVASAIAGGPPVVIWHASEGVLIIILALTTAAVSFRYKKRSVRIFALLGLVAALVAAMGGYLLVSVGPEAGGPLMGNGFIGAYALFFMVLYSTK